MEGSRRRLFRPQSIAAIGGHFAEAVIKQCQKIGYEGEVWPVHPTRKTIAGLPCYPSVETLPSAPDAAFVGVNRNATIDTIRALSENGAGGAVCYASGYAEVAKEDGEADSLQSQLLTAAGDMPFLGPNCYGFINYLDGALLWPDQHGGKRVERGVAILTQSSNMAINLTMQQRGLPIAYCITLGNQAETDLIAAARELITDQRVTAVGLHIEGLGDIVALEALAAEARAAKVPIVAIKIGASLSAQAAVLSHTASMAGAHVHGLAVLHRLGIATVESIPSFLETLKLLHHFGPLPGTDISSMSCSGGEAALIADTAEKYNVSFPPLSDQQASAITIALPEMVVPANPLDYHTFIWGNEERLEEAFVAMLACGFNLNLLIIDFPREDHCNDDDWEITVRALVKARDRTNAHVACLASMPENLPERWSGRLCDQGIAPLAGIPEALGAVEAAAMIGRLWRQPLPRPLLAPPKISAGSRMVLNEAESKKAISDFGIPVPENSVVASSDEAVQWAAKRPGAVALKALGITHKSERQAVRLFLTNTAEIASAASDLLTLADKLLIEDMVSAAIAELIVGVKTDPVYGYALTIGAGGILTELMKDVAVLPLPASQGDIEKALMSLKVYPILNGFRGKANADVSAAISAVESVVALVEHTQGDLLELDINPLIIKEKGCGVVAADALIVQTR